MVRKVPPLRSERKKTTGDSLQFPNRNFWIFLPDSDNSDRQITRSHVHNITPRRGACDPTLEEVWEPVVMSDLSKITKIVRLVVKNE